MSRDFVNNALVTKSEYVSALAADKTQFPPDRMMPPGGPQVSYGVSKLAGVITGPVNLSAAYTDSFVTEASRQLGYAG